ncbi:hypothetical protein EON65_33635 [archaeon]|nr:MAG: hypothetical protein EON65_33635 [archaeon]
MADLLRSSKCNLTKLKLNWNMIRLGGANDLAQSISVNKTLTSLDLSYNSLSTEGGIILGMSLLKNNTLETIAVANNSLDATACFCICAGVIENRKLKKVVLDGNPIGVQGVRVLMMVPLIAGNRVSVSAANCNTSIKDTKCWFDFDKLIRDYTLHLDNGFERAVAIILVHLIAGHPSYIFSKFDYETTGKTSKVKSIDLLQEVSTENVQYFTTK